MRGRVNLFVSGFIIIGVTPMDAEHKEQLRKIRIARARLNAEIKVALAVLPEFVSSCCHFDGWDKAKTRYPAYKELLEEMYGR